MAFPSAGTGRTKRSSLSAWESSVVKNSTFHPTSTSSSPTLRVAKPPAVQSPVSNEEFFMRLCRRLIQALGKVTVDGFVFRVDVRLRPFGDNGPLAMSFDAMEHYYQQQGREWERYAWIKARVVAGDRNAGQQLLKRLNPFVYRRYLDYRCL